MGEKLVSLRNIKYLEFIKVKRKDWEISEFKEDWAFTVYEGEEKRFRNLGLFGHILKISRIFVTYFRILGTFWHILKILKINLNLYKICATLDAIWH